MVFRRSNINIKQNKRNIHIHFFRIARKSHDFLSKQKEAKYIYDICVSKFLHRNCSSRFILIWNCARYGNLKTGSRCWKCFTMPEIYCAPKNARIHSMQTNLSGFEKNGKNVVQCKHNRLLTETLYNAICFIIFNFLIETNLLLGKRKGQWNIYNAMVTITMDSQNPINNKCSIVTARIFWYSYISSTMEYFFSYK